MTRKMRGNVIPENKLNESVMRGLLNVDTYDYNVVLAAAEEIRDKLNRRNPRVHLTTADILMVLAACGLRMDRKRFSNVLKE